MRAELQSTGANDLVVASVTQTIDDFQAERLLSGDYERYARSRVSYMMEQQYRSLSSLRSSNFNPSDSIDTENTNV